MNTRTQRARTSRYGARRGLRHCGLELVLVAAIATLQCVWWTSVDDAQPVRDGRAGVASTVCAHGGIGAPVILTGVVPGRFVFGAPALSFVAAGAGSPLDIRQVDVEIDLAPRPPPPAA
jgi:hypothetical protein